MRSGSVAYPENTRRDRRPRERQPALSGLISAPPPPPQPDHDGSSHNLHKIRRTEPLDILTLWVGFPQSNTHVLQDLVDLVD